MLSLFRLLVDEVFDGVEVVLLLLLLLCVESPLLSLVDDVAVDRMPDIEMADELVSLSKIDVVVADESFCCCLFALSSPIDSDES